MIKIICIGKIKESYFRDACKEYLKRLSKYVKTEVIELSDVNQSDLKHILIEEASEIKKHISNKDYIITLEIDGNRIDSVELSNKIDKTFVEYPNIVFIIGGSHGLDDSIKQISNYKLSFSSMTFPHQMFRVMLLEQLYRSYKIINNEIYHK